MYLKLKTNENFYRFTRKKLIVHEIKELVNSMSNNFLLYYIFDERIGDQKKNILFYTEFDRTLYNIENIR